MPNYPNSLKSSGTLLTIMKLWLYFYLLILKINNNPKTDQSISTIIKRVLINITWIYRA